MRFDWLGKWGMIYFEWPQRQLGLALLALYALLFTLLFVQFTLAYYERRREFKGTWLRRSAWLLLWLALGAVLANVLVLEWPAPGLPREFGRNREAIAFLVYVPIVVAAAQLGSGSAMLVGIVAGWISGAYDSGRLFQVVELGMLGLLSSLLLYQDYKGKLGIFLRQPLVAVPMAGLTTWIVGMLSILAYTESNLSILSAVSITIAILMANLPVVLIQSFVAGAILQTAYALWPRLRAVQKPQRVPPYGRSISMRFLFFFLPGPVRGRRPGLKHCRKPVNRPDRSRGPQRVRRAALFQLDRPVVAQWAGSRRRSTKRRIRKARGQPRTRHQDHALFQPDH